MMTQTFSFNFTSAVKADFIQVNSDAIPVYNEEVGYGFVPLTSAFPPRVVHLRNIQATEDGYILSEPYFQKCMSESPDDYNHFGFAFRVAVPPGGYQITVKTTCPTNDVMISISGMRPNAPERDCYWDAAKQIPVKQFVECKEDEWHFSYANGREFIDIEVEPKVTNRTVGIKEIIITPIPTLERQERENSTLFLLGDSTVKSYTFEEAPMHGWGQVFYSFFNEEKVNVVNYAMGGRSFKSAYSEGRFNDILLTAKAGDYIILQFGHNDERTDEGERFGRGSTENMYRAYIKHLYIPAIRARGLIPIFVTPMSRIDSRLTEGCYRNSFVKRMFPDMLKEIGRELKITTIDLNTKSLEYYNEIGVKATKALFMSIEAGETPGKTNDGTYANGHPSNKIDGTHFKEALAHQFARMIVTEFALLGSKGNLVAKAITSFITDSVKKAITTGNWDEVLVQCCKDTMTGDQAYYRNQIEKVVQLNVMHKDECGYFYPNRPMETEEFRRAVASIMKVNLEQLASFQEAYVTRERMAVVLYDAYMERFDGHKLRYMTDYNDVENHITYDPLTPFEKLKDIAEISPVLYRKVKGAYELGLVRSEEGMVRGKITNGTYFEPREVVTRAKAAKALYFMWVLSHPIGVENGIQWT